eukprot:m.86603 g.86603  ORF g.86603 m.86603 type:complete len:604 (-) comp13561_c0_seq2:94-1905(-)
MPPFPADLPMDLTDSPELSSLLHSPLPLPTMDASTIEQCLLAAVPPPESSARLGSLLKRASSASDAAQGGGGLPDRDSGIVTHPSAAPEQAATHRTKRKKTGSSFTITSTEEIPHFQSATVPMAEMFGSASASVFPFPPVAGVGIGIGAAPPHHAHSAHMAHGAHTVHGAQVAGHLGVTDPLVGTLHDSDNSLPLPPFAITGAGGNPSLSYSALHTALAGHTAAPPFSMSHALAATFAPAALSLPHTHIHTHHAAHTSTHTHRLGVHAGPATGNAGDSDGMRYSAEPLIAGTVPISSVGTAVNMNMHAAAPRTRSLPGSQGLELVVTGKKVAEWHGHNEHPAADSEPATPITPSAPLAVATPSTTRRARPARRSAMVAAARMDREMADMHAEDADVETRKSKTGRRARAESVREEDPDALEIDDADATDDDHDDMLSPTLESASKRHSTPSLPRGSADTPGPASTPGGTAAGDSGRRGMLRTPRAAANKREPQQAEYASEEEFRLAWTKWRKARDSNNQAVKRSRDKRRGLGGRTNPARVITQLTAEVADLKELIRALAHTLRTHEPLSLRNERKVDVIVEASELDAENDGEQGSDDGASPLE